MKVRNLALVVCAAALLGGCASYGYRGGSGDYYYGRTSTTYQGYGAPYGSVGYGYPRGWGGSIGYGTPYRYGYSHRYSRYPGYGYGYYPPYYQRPIVVHPRPPRPGHGRPDDDDHGKRGSRKPPWRDLENIRRVEHRERPERIEQPRPAGVRRPAVQERSRSGGVPRRGNGVRQVERPQVQSRAPAAVRQSPPRVERRAAPAPRAGRPQSRLQERELGRIRER